MIDCVVPAAGEGYRFADGVKQLALLEGRPLIVHVLARALAVCDRCIVVTGAHREAVEAVIDEASSVSPSGVRRIETVYNPGWREGMISSIAAGAARVRTPWFFVAPADMPGLPVEVFRRLLEWARDRGTPDPSDTASILSVAPGYRGRPGHPVLVSTALREELLAEYHRFGSMREFLRRYPRDEYEVNDPGVVFDVDRREDLASRPAVDDNSEWSP